VTQFTKFVRLCSRNNKITLMMTGTSAETCWWEQFE